MHNLKKIICSLITVVLALPLHAEVEYEWPALPSFVPEDKPVGSILPKIKKSLLIDESNETPGIHSGERFSLKGFEFVGNTQLSRQQLSTFVQRFLNKQINISDLYVIRDKITEEYIRLGYVNSGVLLPDQQITDGVIRFVIIEGKAKEIHITTDGRLNSRYIRDPLKRSVSPVLNVFKLEEQLQLLQQDMRIKTVDARLEPTEEQGDAILNVKVVENTPYDFHAEINNHTSPNIGAEGIKLSARHHNLTGSGNQLVANLEKTEGLSRFGLKYSQPIIGSNSSVDVFADVSQSLIVDEKFKTLDIKDQSQTLQFSLREANIRNINTRSDWYITAYYKHGVTFLKGEPFSFGDPRDDGELDLMGFRFGADWTFRAKKQVLVIGLSSNVGIPIPDDDVDEDEVAIDPTGPDGKSFVLNGHFQWARKLDFYHSQIISRFDVQLSDSALYGMQQFSLGGHGTVRGYRENLLVRDNGMLGSVEFRIPYFFKSGSTAYKLSALVFAEGGKAWQTGRKDNGPRVIASVGNGIIATVNKKTHAKIYWAYALRDIQHLGETNLQDYGFHFSLSTSW